MQQGVEEPLSPAVTGYTSGNTCSDPWSASPLTLHWGFSCRYNCSCSHPGTQLRGPSRAVCMLRCCVFSDCH